MKIYCIFIFFTLIHLHLIIKMIESCKIGYTVWKKPLIKSRNTKNVLQPPPQFWKVPCRPIQVRIFWSPDFKQTTVSLSVKMDKGCCDWITVISNSFSTVISTEMKKWNASKFVPREFRKTDTFWPQKRVNHSPWISCSGGKYKINNRFSAGFKSETTVLFNFKWGHCSKLYETVFNLNCSTATNSFRPRFATWPTDQSISNTDFTLVPEKERNHIFLLLGPVFQKSAILW